MVRVTQQTLIDEAEKDNLSLSNQAKDMLMKTDNPLENTKKLIEYAKAKKMIIAGGDVVRFIAQGQIPTSIWTSDDIEEIQAKLTRLEHMLIDIKRKLENDK